MGKVRQLSPELWPLIDVILYSYIELIIRGGVSCLPAALLFTIENPYSKIHFGDKKLHLLTDFQNFCRSC